MPPYRGTVGTPHAAVPLPTITSDVDDHLSTPITGIVSGGASVETTHAASSQMQRSADTDDSFQHVGKRLVGVSIVQVPALAIMVGQPRIGSSGREMLVQQSSPLLGKACINDRQPFVNHSADGRMLTGPRTHERRLHPKSLRAVNDARTIARPVVSERGGHQNRILTVRVEMHKGITSD